VKKYYRVVQTHVTPMRHVPRPGRGLISVSVGLALEEMVLLVKRLIHVSQTFPHVTPMQHAYTQAQVYLHVNAIKDGKEQGPHAEK